MILKKNWNLINQRNCNNVQGHSHIKSFVKIVNTYKKKLVIKSLKLSSIRKMINQ